MAWQNFEAIGATGLKQPWALSCYESISIVVISRQLSSCLVLSRLVTSLCTSAWLRALHPQHMQSFPVTEIDILSNFMCHLLSLPLIANLTKIGIPNRLNRLVISKVRHCAPSFNSSTRLQSFQPKLPAKRTRTPATIRLFRFEKYSLVYTALFIHNEISAF